jgi:hypothetical protein
VEVEPGWLGRSLDRAHENVAGRPFHLRPERYRRCVGCGAPHMEPHRRGCSQLVGEERGTVMMADCERP